MDTNSNDVGLSLESQFFLQQTLRGIEKASEQELREVLEGFLRYHLAYVEITKQMIMQGFQG